MATTLWYVADPNSYPRVTLACSLLLQVGHFKRGLCVRAGRIFIKGDCVCEDMIVARPAYRLPFPPIAATSANVA